jgi:GDPmannose 4,6-dehydratase
MGVAALFRQRGLFVSCGILYNHESRYRPVGFLSQKIATAARNRGRIRIGRLDATVDWGWADDTVRAMRAILAADAPDDFVVATGVPHTVRDFVDVAFRAVGLDWRDYVEEDERVLHKEQATLIGNATKLRTVTGWKPSVSFEEMVARLVSGDA